MKIYGVAFLAGCYLVGQLIGQYLGIFLEIGGNVAVWVSACYFCFKGILIDNLTLKYPYIRLGNFSI